MAYTILPSRRSRQPQGPVGINANHWLTPDLLALVRPHMAYNEVGAGRGTNVNAPTVEAFTPGLALKTNGSNNYQHFNDLPLGGNAGVSKGLTIFSLSIGPSGASDIWSASLNNGTSNDFIFGLCQVSTNKLRNWARDNVANSSIGNTSSSAIAFDSTPHFNALTWDRTNLYTSVDGVDQGSPNSWPTIYFPSTARLSIGALWIGYALGFWSGSTFLVGVVRRYLPPNALKELAQAPWQLFAPIQRRIYFPSASAALEPRYGRPISDTSAGSWLPSTGSDLYAMLDEDTPGDDADYIYASTATVAVLKCTSLDLTSMTTPRISVKVPSGYSPEGTLTVQLYQGDPSTGTLIAEVEQVDPAAGTYTHTLTAGEIAEITDGTDLYWRIEAA